MQVIRQSLFETNSSSTHSIVIKGPSGDYDTFALDGGVCEICPGEFGWGPNTYNDSHTKAAYCLTWAMSSSDNGNRDNHLALLKEVMQEHTGAKKVMFCSMNSKWQPFGYIDHQSSHVCAKAFEDTDSLKNFIFSPQSLLRIDNDNH